MSNGYPANNVYIGARYVPKLVGEWDGTKETAYEPLIIVTYQGNSYTSRQYVPAGIDISNTEYWVLTGNFNGQIESFRLALDAINSLAKGLKPLGAYPGEDDSTKLINAINDGGCILDRDISLSANVTLKANCYIYGNGHTINTGNYHFTADTLNTTFVVFQSIKFSGTKYAFSIDQNLNNLYVNSCTFWGYECAFYGANSPNCQAIRVFQSLFVDCDNAFNLSNINSLTIDQCYINGSCKNFGILSGTNINIVNTIVEPSVFGIRMVDTMSSRIDGCYIEYCDPPVQYTGITKNAIFANNRVVRSNTSKTGGTRGMVNIDVSQIPDDFTERVIAITNNFEALPDPELPILELINSKVRLYNIDIKGNSNKKLTLSPSTDRYLTDGAVHMANVTATLTNITDWTDFDLSLFQPLQIHTLTAIIPLSAGETSDPKTLPSMRKLSDYTWQIKDPVSGTGPTKYNFVILYQ